MINSDSKPKTIEYLQIITNIILVLFTFWLGIYVQNIVAETSSNASNALTKIEYSEKIKPIVDSLNVNYGDLWYTFYTMGWEFTSGRNLNMESAKNDSLLIAFFIQNEDRICDYYNEVAYSFLKIKSYNLSEIEDTNFANVAAALPLVSVLLKSSMDSGISKDSLVTLLQCVMTCPEYLINCGLSPRDFASIDSIVNVYVSKYAFDEIHAWKIESERIKETADSVTIKNQEELDSLIYCLAGLLNDKVNTKHHLVCLKSAIDLHIWISKQASYIPHNQNTKVGFMNLNAVTALIFTIILVLVIFLMFAVLFTRRASKVKGPGLGRATNEKDALKQEIARTRRETNKQLEKIKSDIRDIESSFKETNTNMNNSIDVLHKSIDEMKSIIEDILNISKQDNSETENTNK